MSAITEELVRDLPKTDVHVHLDGSLRPETLLELAEEQGVPLPADSVDGLYREVFKESYADLPDYLRGFALTCAAMRSEGAVERCAYELCVDSFAEGVRYLEMRFAPQLLTQGSFGVLEVLEAAARGLKRAEDEWNGRPAVARGEEPPFRAAILVCALRNFEPGFSEEFARIAEEHQDGDPAVMRGAASLAAARAAVEARDRLGLPVTGVDLAGAERGYPAKDHVEAYAYAHDAFLGKTVHAGEDYGPESVFQAITDCHADRIGHGTWIFREDMLDDPHGLPPKEYVQRLVQYVAERRITLEVCPTSNLQTMPQLQGRLERHPLRQMLDARLSVTLSTDNRLVSRTTVTREYLRVAGAFALKPRDLREILVYGFKRGFFPGTYLEKRAFVRRILDYRDRVLQRHGALD